MPIELIRDLPLDEPPPTEEQLAECGGEHHPVADFDNFRPTFTTCHVGLASRIGQGFTVLSRRLHLDCAGPVYRIAFVDGVEIDAACGEVCWPSVSEPEPDVVTA